MLLKIDPLFSKTYELKTAVMCCNVIKQISADDCTHYRRICCVMFVGCIMITGVVGLLAAKIHNTSYDTVNATIIMAECQQICDEYYCVYDCHTLVTYTCRSGIHNITINYPNSPIPLNPGEFINIDVNANNCAVLYTTPPLDKVIILTFAGCLAAVMYIYVVILCIGSIVWNRANDGLVINENTSLAGSL